MIKVYDHPLSPYSQKVKTSVREALEKGLFKREYRDHRRPTRPPLLSAMVDA